MAGMIVSNQIIERAGGLPPATPEAGHFQEGNSMEYFAIFLVCLGVLALIWASARTERGRSRRGPKK